MKSNDAGNLEKVSKKYNDWLWLLPGLVLFVLGVPFILPPNIRPLDENERLNLSKSRDIICQVDKKICAVASDNSLEIKVWDKIVPHWRTAEVNAYGSSPRIMYLEDDVFNNLAHLTVVYYHELRHVEDTRVSYDMNNITLEQCLDHNEVRRKTQEFARKIDHLFISDALAGYPSDELPTYHATHDSGNIIEDCDKNGGTSEQKY